MSGRGDDRGRGGGLFRRWMTEVGLCRHSGGHYPTPSSDSQYPSLPSSSSSTSQNLSPLTASSLAGDIERKLTLQSASKSYRRPPARPWFGRAGRKSVIPANDDAMVPSIFSIPNPILMEILSKLPVTAIRNCRCVCSCFRNLISDPQFAQLHLSAASQPSLMLRSYYSLGFPTYFVESIILYSGNIWISNNTILKFELKCDVAMEEFEVLSSCNGLICFYCPTTYDPYVICNPVINEYVIVPQICKDDDFHQCGSGFGFCPRTNQYKVLRLLSPKIGYGSKFEAEINTLGTDLWRRVGDAPCYLHQFSHGCFLNGALHWIVCNTEQCFESMCCFNFEEERFRSFPGPSQFCGLFGQFRVDKMEMGVLNNVLSVFYRPTGEILEIWMMKDYAVQESWTKYYVVEIPRKENFRAKLFRPLLVLNEDIMLCCSSSYFMLSLNMKTRKFTKVMFNGIISVNGATIYSPSFVSIMNAAAGRHS